MKYITLIIGLLVGGCATTPTKELTPEENKALRDSVVGTYEQKYVDGVTYRVVLLDNGVYEWYVEGKKSAEAKWEIVNRQIHCDYGSGEINIIRINQDKSITLIAFIRDGKRKDRPIEPPFTWKKIK